MPPMSGGGAEGHAATAARAGTEGTEGTGLVVADEVRDALASGRGVVALESTIISHGLPTETSAATAREIEAAVRSVGAVPATVAVVDGTVRVGLGDDELVRVAEGPDVVKASVRDLGPVVGGRRTGATTVAATAYLAHRAGIRLFATGGLGGVHRGARETWDESADLAALSAVPVTVVCAGVKSILDTAATLERLESLSVPVLGYGTDAMPGFYVRDSGLAVPWRVDSPEEVAAVVQGRDALGLPQAVVVAQPVDPGDEMDPDQHERTLVAGLAEAERQRVTGKDVTPFLLGWFHEHTGGASLAANVALVLANARLAGRVAVLLSDEVRTAG
jgi:pseudouridylate synthase